MKKIKIDKMKLTEHNEKTLKEWLKVANESETKAAIMLCYSDQKSITITDKNLSPDMVIEILEKTLQNLKIKAYDQLIQTMKNSQNGKENIQRDNQIEGRDSRE